MNAKIAMVLVALIGVGLFALPQTTALFAGQHSFANIDATGNQIDCVKCHGDVQAELGTMGYSATTNTSGPHATFKCDYCHRIEPGYSSGDNAYGMVTYRNGTAMRTIVMKVTNYEMQNFPQEINNLGNLSEAAPGIIWEGGAAISPQAAGTETLDITLQYYNDYLKPTYNSATGEPYDTSANKDMGFNPGAIGTANGTDWTKGSRYWTPTLLNAGSKAVNPGTAYHAASLVSCLECHGGVEPLGHYSRVLDGEEAASCEQCHYGYPSGYRWTELGAGGFGLTAGVHDNGSSEAHNEFVGTNDELTRFKGGASNGACVACHTHVAVEINYTRPDTYKFDANFFSSGNEEVGGFSATGMVSSNSSGN
ncbi:MAG: hypothetical protein SCH70_12855 [Candidatus Methanoperedens sp.]|nr:hypothetical protein [Candidatus Methanoperedens sp.]